MVMSIYSLLRNKPRPTMEDITQALAGRSSDFPKSVVKFWTIYANFLPYHVPIRYGSVPAFPLMHVEMLMLQ